MAMRITNQMISNNSLRNMQKSMREVDKRTQQMTTGKKISKASEDPVTAIRALKLRTTVNQLEQYKDKNIPDAGSWFDITTTSLDNITKRIKDINEYCVQGSTDSFSTTDRSSIIDALKEIKDMIYDEGNSTYAGRYVFSGYKTDRSLAFSETDSVSDYSYDIVQHLDSKAFDTKKVVLNSVDYTKAGDYINGTDTYEQPNPETVYRLNLGYEAIDDTNNAGTNVFSLKAFDSNGDPIDLSAFTINIKDTSDSDSYYEVSPNEINVIKETGEIIMGEDAYNTIKQAADIEVSYAKNKFVAGDLRPEHYYDCTQYTIQSDGSVKTTQYEKAETGQPIYYEVNFNQSIQVNTEGTKLMDNALANRINDLIYALRDLDDAEKAKVKLTTMLDDPQYAGDEAAVKKLNQYIYDIDVEIAVKKENMQKTFSNNITNFQTYLAEIAAVQSDVGSRMSKLSMIETRVKEQYAEFKELKSKNEDVETDQAIIDFNEANLVYESALAATSNVMKKSLMDYL